MGYEIVIGLEVHVQLKTATKLFCGCRYKFGAEPNTQTCPVCLGLPGVLPVLNKQAFDYALRAALALNCKIDSPTKFDRKNYFYPDLPKNYQISQYDIPFAKNGHLDIRLTNHDARPTTPKRIGITRVHLEEDAGKLIHPERPRPASGVMGEASQNQDAADAPRRTQNAFSLVDMNRCGVPLLEIVTEPELSSPEEAYAYLGALKEIMHYLDISDCDMEKGSLRCDANLSLRPAGAKGLGVKSEIKNINSFKFVKNALAYEAKRQKELLDKGERVIQETRLWDEAEGMTKPMRSKEEAHDYRYFPEPDLVPVTIDHKWLEEVRKVMPELPEAKRQRLVSQYGISEYEAGIFTQEKVISEYAEKDGLIGNKTARNIFIVSGLQIFNEQMIEFDEFAQKVPPVNLLGLAKQLEDKTIVSTKSVEVLKEMVATGKRADEIISSKGLEQVSDAAALEPIVQEVLNNNPKIVADYKGGKAAARESLLGQVMRASKGKANPQLVREILTKLLDKSK